MSSVDDDGCVLSCAEETDTKLANSKAKQVENCMKKSTGNKASKNAGCFEHPLLYCIAKRTRFVFSAREMGLSSLESTKPRSTVAKLVGYPKITLSTVQANSRSWLSESRMYELREEI